MNLLKPLLKKIFVCRYSSQKRCDLGLKRVHLFPQISNHIKRHIVKQISPKHIIINNCTVQFKPITYNRGSHSKLEVTADCHQLSKWGCPTWQQPAAAGTYCMMEKIPKKTKTSSSFWVTSGLFWLTYLNIDHLWYWRNGSRPPESKTQSLTSLRPCVQLASLMYPAAGIGSHRF